MAGYHLCLLSVLKAVEMVLLGLVLGISRCSSQGFQLEMRGMAMRTIPGLGCCRVMVTSGRTACQRVSDIE